MSRTIKQPLTGGKAVDHTCRNNGTCHACLNNRTIAVQKQAARADYSLFIQPNQEIESVLRIRDLLAKHA
jgi:hypothetical protein